MMILTERLILRPWCDADAESLYEYARDDRVGPAAGWPVHTSVENSREIIRGVLSEPETYAVCLKEDNRAIGSIGLMVGKQSNLGLPENEGEIGYWIGVPFWGQGLIPEAVRALTRRAFIELGLTTLWCGYFDGNDKSRRAQEKCGFVYHHTNRDVYWRLTDRIMTEHVTRLPRDVWESSVTPAERVTIRPETHGDYKDVVSLVLRSFREGTDYSDGKDIVALIEEIRDSGYRIPELSFVAELDGEIVGHFLFSRFPLSRTPEGGHGGAADTDVVMLAPVSVHADRLRQGIGSAMIRLGIAKVMEMGFRGIIVEGNFRFYNTVGFRTSSEYGIYPVSGYPMTEPRCQMCMETFPGSLQGRGGYVVYDMYHNA